ncbi:MAG: 3-phosphoshikimate 1-carboxyvinyltransferase [Armatimonadetes bacterium]|nr:3-phosphoshikimate 1-carboxyvinyltransferase [Armatimonadota bacterium]
MGTVRPPGDKSMTHRALILAAMADESPSRIGDPLIGEDCMATAECLGECGADIEFFEPGEFGSARFAIVGRERPWSSPDVDLYCGNSGTSMRLLAGVLASVPGLDCRLTGDASLSRRPMRRVVGPLRDMGASIEGDTAPISIRGRTLNGIRYLSPVASAQVKTCLLLAGLKAQGETWVSEPSVSRDHTERMLEGLGIEVMRDGNLCVGVRGGQRIPAVDFDVPGDVSSAAFFLVAAAMTPGSDVRLVSVGVNPTRTGVLDALHRAGATVERDVERESTGEPVADLRVTGSGCLRAFEVGGDDVPRLVDEIPVLAVLATQCEGTTRIRDAAELRVKESDRLKTMAEGLREMGAAVIEHEDGLDVSGPTPLRGTTIDAEGDHRIAMAFAVAGLVATGETTVLNAQSVDTSYPAFESDLRRLRHDGAGLP